VETSLLLDVLLYPSSRLIVSSAAAMRDEKAYQNPNKQSVLVDQYDRISRYIEYRGER
jgi:hypothetical protein